MTKTPLKGYLENICKYSEMPIEEISKELFIGIVAMTVLDDDFCPRCDNDDDSERKKLISSAFLTLVTYCTIEEDLFWIASDIFWADNKQLFEIKLRFFKYFEPVINPATQED